MVFREFGLLNPREASAHRLFRGAEIKRLSSPPSRASGRELRENHGTEKADWQ